MNAKNRTAELPNFTVLQCKTTYIKHNIFIYYTRCVNLSKIYTEISYSTGLQIYFLTYSIEQVAQIGTRIFYQNSSVAQDLNQKSTSTFEGKQVVSDRRKRI